MSDIDYKVGDKITTAKGGGHGTALAIFTYGAKEYVTYIDSVSSDFKTVPAFLLKKVSTPPEPWLMYATYEYVGESGGATWDNTRYRCVHVDTNGAGVVAWINGRGQADAVVYSTTKAFRRVK